MLTKKGDFIELSFTARTSEGIFDTTDEQIAKQLGYKKEVKPIKIIIGENMIIKGLDKELEGKEVGKNYEIAIQPKDGFGERKAELIKAVSMNAFNDKRILQEGKMLFIDGFIAKVTKVGSGRVLLDFNHPLAGKVLNYSFKIIRIINDEQEKLEAILNYFQINDYKIEKKENFIELKLKQKDSNKSYGEVQRVIELIEKYLKNVKVSIQR